MTDEAEAHDSAEPGSGKPEPQFIIAHDGKYYLTRSVWEYDPRHPSITREQQIGVGEVADLLTRLAREGWSRSAVIVPGTHIRHNHSHQHTS